MAYTGNRKINPDTGKEFIEGDPKPINPFLDGFKLQKNSLTDGKKMLFVRYSVSKKPYPNGDLKLIFSEAVEKNCTYCGELFETGNRRFKRCKKCRDLKWDGVSDGKYRLNPDTGKKFEGDDPRPKNSAECGKKYPQDDRLFRGYIDRIDTSTGYKHELWLVPEELKCLTCDVSFMTGAGYKYCEKHRNKQKHKYTSEEKREIKKRKSKPCLAEEKIKKITGCTDKWLPLTEEYFPKRKDKRKQQYYFLNLCRKCYSELSWEQGIIKKYNVTAEQFYEELEKQGGVCAICKSDDSNQITTAKKDRFFIDHDHVSGINRGLLCTKCNTMIGEWAGRDDPQILYAGFEYLAYSVITNIQNHGEPISGFAKTKPIKNFSDLFDNLKTDLLKENLPDEVKSVLLKAIKK